MHRGVGGSHWRLFALLYLLVGFVIAISTRKAWEGSSLFERLAIWLIVLPFVALLWRWVHRRKDCED